jgi:hypothetical protein
MKWSSVEFKDDVHLPSMSRFLLNVFETLGYLPNKTQTTTSVVPFLIKMVMSLLWNPVFLV